MTKPKKTKVQKKLYLTVREVDNGYTMVVERRDGEDEWGNADTKTYVFKSRDELIDNIDNLI